MHGLVLTTWTLEVQGVCPLPLCLAHITLLLRALPPWSILIFSEGVAHCSCLCIDPCHLIPQAASRDHINWLAAIWILLIWWPHFFFFVWIQILPWKLFCFSLSFEQFLEEFLVFFDLFYLFEPFSDINIPTE